MTCDQDLQNSLESSIFNIVCIDIYYYKGRNYTMFFLASDVLKHVLEVTIYQVYTCTLAFEVTAQSLENISHAFHLKEAIYIHSSIRNMALFYPL